MTKIWVITPVPWADEPGYRQTKDTQERKNTHPHSGIDRFFATG